MRLILAHLQSIHISVDLARSVNTFLRRDLEKDFWQVSQVISSSLAVDILLNIFLYFLD